MDGIGMDITESAYPANKNCFYWDKTMLEMYAIEKFIFAMPENKNGKTNKDKLRNFRLNFSFSHMRW